LQKNHIIILAAVVLVIVVAAGAGWWFTNSSLSTQEKARDATINYIRTNHEIATLVTNNLQWEGGIRENYQAGVETYIYSTPTQGWTVIIQYPFVSNPTYSIEAVYTLGGIIVDWHGNYQGGTITETGFTKTP
jgi:hypothetical protein